MKYVIISICMCVCVISCSKQKFDTMKESMFNKSIKGREMLVDVYYSIEPLYTFRFATIQLSIPATVDDGFPQTASPVRISITNTSPHPLKLYTSRTRITLGASEFKCLDKKTVIDAARHEDMSYLTEKQIEKWKERDQGVRERAVNTHYLETISIETGKTVSGVVYFDRLIQNKLGQATICELSLFFEGKERITIAMKNNKLLKEELH